MGELDCALGSRYCGDLVDCSGVQTLGLAQQVGKLPARGRTKRSFKKPCPHCQNLRGTSIWAGVNYFEGAGERISAMSELATALYDEEVLHSDEVGPVIRRPLFISST